LEEDLRVMQVGRWWEKVRSKEEWRPRPTPGCNAEEEEEECISETSVYSETTRRYIPEDCNLYTRRCDNLKSHNKNHIKI
jgi:ribosomal protein S15P/S13E